MSHTRGFNDIRVNTACLVTQSLLLVYQLLCHPAAYLSDLERMGKPVVEDMAFIGRKNLRYSSKPSESGREQDPIAIALSFGSVIRWTIH